MGETRAKKPSKRSLKAHKEVDAKLTADLSTLKISNVTINPSEQCLSALTSPESNNSPRPSTKLSKESMHSVASAARSGETYDDSLIEMKHTEAKGFAVFATSRISAGTLILVETPTIRLTKRHEEEGSADDVLRLAYTNLANSSQKLFLSLFDSQKAGFSRVKSIYYSNCYNLDKRSSLGGSCIGLMASRINHSCVPNAQISFDDATGKMHFYALKPISKGKEICSNYDTVFDTRDQRQRKQVLHYGFFCDCEACEQVTEFWARSDERRLEMIRARKIAREFENQWQIERFDTVQIAQVVTQLERMENAMIKEGLLGDPLVNVYKSLTKWSERARDHTAVKKWYTKELGVVVTSLGEHSVTANAIRDKLRDQQRHIDK